MAPEAAGIDAGPPARHHTGVNGKTCIVTGASAGIGKITARELARQGATVALVCRDRARGEAALGEIAKETGSSKLELFLCDFASQRAIRAFAAEFLTKHSELHVLVNNAGAIHGEHKLTEDGIESTFAVNHIGYFLLTSLLLGILRRSAPARIVNVASAAHQGGKLHLDDLEDAGASYSSFGAYSRSKLANIAFTAELARRLEGTGVTANSLHPGVVGTNFGDSGAAWLRFLVKLGRPFLRSPDSGAATSIYLATSPAVEGVTGKYFANSKPAVPSKLARDAEQAKRLWEKSEQLVLRSLPGSAAATEPASEPGLAG